MRGRLGATGAALAVLLAGAPAAAGAGPAAEPGAPSVEISPGSSRPGDAFLLTARGFPSAPTATVAGIAFPFWRAGDAWRAIAALPVEAAPGTATIEVSAEGVPAVSAPVRVEEPGFRSKTITVAPRFVEPPPAARRRIEEDQKVFDAAWATPFAPPLFSGPFAWPIRAETSGRFGDQRVYNGKKQGVHYGLDLGGPSGAPVAAANDGRVVVARDCYMSGRTVVLAHGPGLFTVYFHLSRIDVEPGQAVKKGERVGLLGATGRATGPHLHFGVKVNGRYVDPESVLRIDFARFTAEPPAPRE